MQFTPQQLSGAGKFHHGVRIGNWNEDIVLEEIRSKSRSLQKLTGLREIDINIQNKSLQTLPVTVLSNSSDEGIDKQQTTILRYGDHIQLTHPKTGRNLSSNVAIRVHSTMPGYTEYQVTASDMKDTTLRNLFRVEPISHEMLAPGSPVLYGDEIQLAALPQLQINPATDVCQRPLLLVSVPGGINSATRQSVTLARITNAQSNQYSRWKFEPIFPTPHSQKHTKVPVNIQEPIKITHSSTGRSLSTTERESILNDFGVEYDVLCGNSQHNGRTHVMIAEFKGERIGDQVTPVLSPNWWKVSCCGDIDTTQLPGQPLCFENVIAAIKTQVRQLVGVPKLMSLLHELDQAQDGILTEEEFCWAILYAGCSLSQDEFQVVTRELASPSSAGGVVLELFEQVMADGLESKE